MVVRIRTCIAFSILCKSLHRIEHCTRIERVAVAAYDRLIIERHRLATMLELPKPALFHRDGTKYISVSARMKFPTVTGMALGASREIGIGVFSRDRVISRRLPRALLDSTKIPTGLPIATVTIYRGRFILSSAKEFSFRLRQRRSSGS